MTYKQKGYVDLKAFHMVKDYASCNCVVWNCDGYTLIYTCATVLYLGL